MQLSRQELATIVARARTLDELLSGTIPDYLSASSDSNFHWLKTWNRAFSAEDVSAFERRLSWDGLQPLQVAPALEDPLPPARLPEWSKCIVKALHECDLVLDELNSAASLPEEISFRGTEPPPFFQLWVPFLRVGKENLLRAVPSARELLTPEALTQLESHLLQTLAAVSALAVYECFDEFRRSGRADGQVYRGFVRTILRSGFASFFLEYSALARQVSLLVQTWTDSTVEFVDRLQSDRLEVSKTLGFSGDPGKVIALHPGLSDRHERGRQVHAVTFESGLKVVYKPRDIGLSHAYNRFLVWLRTHGLESAPAPLRSLAKEGYGWMEYVDQTPARDLEEVRRYYSKAGALLCLGYVLEGKDLHMDNVISGPDGPVLVDVEAVFQPETATPSAASAVQVAAERIRRSVLNSGLLTFLQTDPDGNVYDIGGFRGRGGHVSSNTSCIWKATNTDAMQPEFQVAYAKPMANVLLFRGEAQEPEQFIADIGRGFEQTYRFLTAHRAEILDPDGPLSWFASERSRLIFRPSHLYSLVLDRLITPEYQREGLLGGFLIDSLNRVFKDEVRRPSLWPLTFEERLALENLDIPLFSIPINNTAIRATNGQSIDYFQRSGFQVVLDRLKHLNEADLEAQLELLWTALLPRESLEMVSKESSEPWVDVPPLAASDLVRRAEAIASEILAEAVEGEDGSLTWIAPGYLRLDERSDRYVSQYLYDGSMGIALFFAALSATTASTERYRRAAKAVCKPLEAILSSGEVHLLLAREGLGACNGIGSIVYALATIGSLLDDHSFLQLGKEIAREITEQKIASDRKFDVEGGAAGAILGLLALYRVIPETWLLERAIACGKHLLANARPVSEEAVAWTGQDGAMLAGFAHGAAGMAYALARLSKVSGEAPFIETAWRAYRYERSLFSATEANWPILRSDGSSAGFMTAWCHGAPGIALGRLGALDMIQDVETCQEIDAALETTLRSGWSPIDHLCCGNLGRVDVLLVAGEVLNRPDLTEAAAKRAAAVVRRADQQGGYSLRMANTGKRSLEPGLFRGASGIGYELLRLSAPAALPSVLSFEHSSVQKTIGRSRSR